MSSTAANIVRRGLLLKSVQNLLKPKNSVSISEIKADLRKNYPAYYWDKAFVNRCMDEFVKLGVYKYTNVTETYYDPKKPIEKATAAPKTTPAKSPKKAKVAKSAKKDKWATSARISKSRALAKIQNSKGHFFSVQFTKKGDGTMRTMNCQYLPGQTVILGIVKVKEASLVRSKDANPVRSFDMNTLKKVSIGGQVYNVR